MTTKINNIEPVNFPVCKNCWENLRIDKLSCEFQLCTLCWKKSFYMTNNKSSLVEIINKHINELRLTHGASQEDGISSAFFEI